MGQNEENYWHLDQANNPLEVRYTTHRKHPMDQGYSDEKESLILFAETIGTNTAEKRLRMRKYLKILWGI